MRLIILIICLLMFIGCDNSPCSLKNHTPPSPLYERREVVILKKTGQVGEIRRIFYRCKVDRKMFSVDRVWSYEYGVLIYNEDGTKSHIQMGIKESEINSLPIKDNY